ncbi:MAG: hypothetical protein R3B48_26925 [Kofleriaceae bacterium]
MTERNKPHPDAEVVERMERDLPAQSEAEAETRATYQRLIERVGELDLIEPAEGWEDRAMERWRRESGQRRTAKPPRRLPWRQLTAVAALAAAAALIVLVPRCREAEPRPLQVAIERTGPQSRQRAPAIGDTLRVEVHVDAPAVELRVYRDQELIARCPGEERCRRDGARLSLSLVMNRPGTYEAVRLSSDDALPAPGPTGRDVDVLTAREGGATVISEPAIRVR